jgi:P4 family phage/plasmid primase-like protien
VGYYPDAHSELLDTYRLTFFPDPEHWEALWRLVGSCLIGGNQHRQLIFFAGASTTGKSLLAELIMKALGNYAALSTASIFRGNQDERPRADLMNIMSSRVVFVEEVGHAWELHADRVKDITGGGQLTARKLHSNTYVTRKIEFTVIAVTNELPRIKDADHALLRRVKVIPFTHSVQEGEDYTVRERMLSDTKTLEAVLSEAMQGCARSQKHGVDDLPEAFVAARAAAYGEITGTELVAEFVHDLIERRLLVGESVQGQCAKLGELFELYVTAPGRRSERETRELSARRFGQLLRLLGYEVKNVNGGVRVLGVRLDGSLAVVRAKLEL